MSRSEDVWFSVPLHDEKTAAVTNTNEEEGSEAIRLETEAKLVSTQELTAYKEEEMQLEQVVEGATVQLNKLMDPLPDQEQTRILSRSYQVGNFAWTSIDTRGTTLLQLKFPDVLLQMPQIQSRADYFRLFKAGAVRLRIKLTSTVLHYGKILVASVPGIKANTNDPFISHWVQWCNHNPVLIDASEGSQVDYEAKWSLNRTWFRLPLPVNDVGEMALVSIIVLRELRQASLALATDVDVSVFAEFIDPVMQGPNPRAIAPMAEYTSAVAETVLKSMQSLNVIDQETHDTVSGIVEVVDTAVTVGKVIASVMDKPTTVASAAPFRALIGGDLSQGEGTDTSVKLSLHPEANTTSRDLVGSGGPCPRLLDVIKKPGYMTAFNFNSSIPAGTILTTWSHDPVNAHVVAANEYVPSYLSYFTQPFAYWRGSIAYAVFITAPKFASCKIRVNFYPVDGSPAYPLGLYAGDVVSNVIDVTGPTWFTFLVPYLSDIAYQNIRKIGSTAFFAGGGNGNTSGQIGIELVNTIATPDSHVVTMSGDVWHAAGDDFQVSFMNGEIAPDNINEFFSFNYATYTSAVNDVFESVEPLIAFNAGREEGMVSPEVYEVITTFMKRYYELGAGNIDDTPPTANIINPPYGPDQSGDIPSMIDWFATPFMWHAGGWRFRFYYVNPLVSTSIVRAFFYPDPLNGVHAATNAGQLVNGPAENYIAVEAPYYQMTASLRFEHNAEKRYHELVVTSPFAHALYSVADDYSMGALYSPPHITVVVPPTLTDENEDKKTSHESPFKRLYGKRIPTVSSTQSKL